MIIKCNKCGSSYETPAHPSDKASSEFVCPRCRAEFLQARKTMTDANYPYKPPIVEDPYIWQAKEELVKTVIEFSASNGNLKTFAELDKSVAEYLRVCRDRGVPF